MTAKTSNEERVSSQMCEEMKRRYTWKAFCHDAKLAGVSAMLFIFAFSFYADRCEALWKTRWGVFFSRTVKAEVNCYLLECAMQYEGASFDKLSRPAFIKSVERCSSNVVNNVIYVGTTNRCDCFIHNSDFCSHRVRIEPQCVAMANRMPFTDDASRWKLVSTNPVNASVALAEFLGVERR